MLTIDGSVGEGGGQILRTALALSSVTGTPFRIENIRAGREKPGLLRQHLTAVRAATEISGARVEGATLRSTNLTFTPGPVRSGDFAFSVGTAGSATLVLQTVLPALAIAAGRSSVVLEGGTHNPAAPPFDFLEKSFLPLLNRMGPRVTVQLERAGFYPAGGGRFVVSIEPAARLAPFVLVDRGQTVDRRARALVANLPWATGDREMEVVRRGLSLPPEKTRVEEIGGTHGPGNAVMVEIEMESHTEVFTSFGEMSVRAEAVAEKVVQETRAYLASNLPIGRCLADQLLLPLALAESGAFRTSPPSRHTTTNVDVIRRFLDVSISLVEEPKRVWTVTIG